MKTAPHALCQIGCPHAPPTHFRLGQHVAHSYLGEGVQVHSEGFPHTHDLLQILSNEKGLWSPCCLKCGLDGHCSSQQQPASHKTPLWIALSLLTEVHTASWSGCRLQGVLAVSANWQFQGPRQLFPRSCKAEPGIWGFLTGRSNWLAALSAQGLAKHFLAAVKTAWFTAPAWWPGAVALER